MTEREHARGEAADKQGAGNAKRDALKKNRRRIFYGAFLANHPIAILGLLIGGILVAPITQFPGGTDRELRYVISGLIVLFAVMIFWFIDGYRKLNLPTDEELEEREAEHRRRVESQLGELDSRLNSADARFNAIDRKVSGRKLTSHQIEAIVTALRNSGAVFKAVIRYSQMARDGSQYAMSLGEALRRADWDLVEHAFTFHQEWPLEFCLRASKSNQTSYGAGASRSSSSRGS